MPNVALESRKAALKRRLDSLAGQYQAANDDFDRELSGANKIVIQQQIDALYTEMEKVQADLTQLEDDGMHLHRRLLKLEDHLPKIDFKKAEELILHMLEEPEQEARAALLFLQKSRLLGGKWCVARIREILEGTTGDFRHYSVEFTADAQFDERGLLDRLAGHIPVDAPPDNLEQYAQRIIRKLADAVQSGSVVFLEIKQWDSLSPQERILPWFLSAFWQPLVQELPAIAQTRFDVKIFIFILVNTQLPEECLTAVLRFPPDKFDYRQVLEQPLAKRIVELPLRNWTEKEIKEWLGRFSGRPRAQIDHLARRIFDSSGNGMPLPVYAMLMEELGQGSQP